MKALLAFAALVGTTPPAPSACLSSTEAESVALVALPEILRETGTVCAATLPPTALGRQAASPLLTRYQAEADRAWPAARAALARLSDPAAAMLLQSDFARPVLLTLLVPQLVGRIAPADCGTLDRLATLLAPLPPRNTAGMVVTTLGWLKGQKAKGKAAAVPDLPLCAEAG
jgi:hypothetical protein